MVEKEPSRETAYGAFCAFDDRSEGVLSVGELNGIFCCLGEPLKKEEVDALMCELTYLSSNGKVKIDDLMDFLFNDEPIHIKGNDEALGVGQLQAGGKLK
eukprot:TRINITY_DN6480_c0_g2_i1.p5 TRINITY_DN6480_c0_g2~~TRINITY_DN6480_c0_g2_i1.p5  ORF type:complete len:100 (+),score=29.21 TRINITY_DN6480_c0_g2_i1:809-1108(+)